MNILIAGGTGRVARALENILIKEGHTLYAGCRHPEALEASGQLKPVMLDLHASKEELKKLTEGMDAVYFLAGSRGKDLLGTDLFGAVKLQQAAEESGVSRYIQLSSMFDNEPERWATEPAIADLTDYNIAKLFADEWLIRNTDLDYTIIQAALLEEKEPTGKIEIDPPHDTVNPIGDVAAVLAAVLDNPKILRKVIRISSGSTPVEEALEAI